MLYFKLTQTNFHKTQPLISMVANSIPREHIYLVTEIILGMRCVTPLHGQSRDFAKFKCVKAFVACV